MAQLLRLNIHSPIALTKYVTRMMMTQKGGRIVNISSIVAADGFNALSVYSATKAALVGFTKSLARELGPLDITVNAVAPGFIDTEMTSELGAARPWRRSSAAARSGGWRRLRMSAARWRFCAAMARGISPARC